LESDELGDLLSAVGSRRLHSEEEWRRKDFGCSDALGIMHLIQFALGMLNGDDLS
jgi:hypothetical protein